MHRLASQCAEENLHVTDLPYRFSSWAFDDQENIHLWFDEHRQLVAWAVLQTPFWQIDYVCHPSVEARLHEEILAWADQHASAALDTRFGHPAWFVNVFPGQAGRIHDLEKAGFVCKSDGSEVSWAKVLMLRDVETPVKTYKPPAGFVVRGLAGMEDVKAYVELQQSVFESKNMTFDWRMHTLSHPAYRPDLDIVVESPDGRLVAFCVCWLDEATLDGRVEPLGCHKDFRKYALGRVALSAGLQRLQARGARKIFVETDQFRNTAFRLYESFDFRVHREVLVYGKEYGGMPQ